MAFRSQYCPCDSSKIAVVFRSLCCSYGSGKTHIEQQGNHRDATKLDLSTRTLVYLYRSRVQLKELPLMFF